MPMAPVCLDTARYDRGFKFRSQISACRVGMENYRSALGSWHQCVIEDLTERYNQYLED